MSVTVSGIQKVISGTSQSTNANITMSVTVDDAGKVTSFNGNFTGKTGITANGNFSGSNDYLNLNCNQGRDYAAEVIAAVNAAIPEIIAAATPA